MGNGSARLGWEINNSLIDLNLKNKSRIRFKSFPTLIFFSYKNIRSEFYYKKTI